MLGIDLEDDHAGECREQAAEQRVAAMMRKAFSGASVITASSPLILQQCQPLIRKKNVQTAVIRNVFSLDLQPVFNDLPGLPLRLVWFSQTVGLNRGIQDAVRAMDKIRDFAIHLTIIGHCSASTREGLVSLLTEKKHTIKFKPPMTEEQLVLECSRHHIGLALEPGFSRNNSLALSNKLFTYLLAGNALVVSETAAQKKFLDEYPATGAGYPIGDSNKLTDLFSQWVKHPQRLLAARKQAWALARTTLNWEVESNRLLALYTPETKSEAAPELAVSNAKTKL